jgi:hypothetical protein
MKLVHQTSENPSNPLISRVYKHTAKQLPQEAVFNKT